MEILSRIDGPIVSIISCSIRPVGCSCVAAGCCGTVLGSVLLGEFECVLSVVR